MMEVINIIKKDKNILSSMRKTQKMYIQNKKINETKNL